MITLVQRIPLTSSSSLGGASMVRIDYPRRPADHLRSGDRYPQAPTGRQYSTSEGYWYNDATALPGTGAINPAYTRAPHDQSYMIRLTALWDPFGQFTARLKLNSIKTKPMMPVLFSS